MIFAYGDVSMDDPILSVGYVVNRVERGQETLLDTGTRVLDMDEHPRDIDWNSTKGEAYAGIIAARGALDYTDDPLVLHLDNEYTVRTLVEDAWPYEAYFPHALYSFLERFENYQIRLIHRINNEAAHEQARIGLKVARDIREGAV